MPATVEMLKDFALSGASGAPWAHYKWNMGVVGKHFLTPYICCDSILAMYYYPNGAHVFSAFEKNLLP